MTFFTGPQLHAFLNALDISMSGLAHAIPESYRQGHADALQSIRQWLGTPDVPTPEASAGAPSDSAWTPLSGLPAVRPRETGSVDPRLTGALLALDTLVSALDADPPELDVARMAASTIRRHLTLYPERHLGTEDTNV
jgi:hypothetical protein